MTSSNFRAPAAAAGQAAALRHAGRRNRFKAFIPSAVTALLLLWSAAAAGTAKAGTIEKDTVYTQQAAHADSSATSYDRRIHRYRKSWNALIPTQHVIQFCGNMGIVSAGIGWDYGKHRQWETHLLLGVIPKYDSRRVKITMTLKQNYIPWSVYINDGWSMEPLQCGLYLNTVFGHDFWTKQPTKYESGYYPFSTRLRPNVFVGERFTKSIPNNRRKYIKSLSLFYELSTNDIYIMHYVHTGSIGFWDLFGLSIGIKAQLL